MAIIEKPISANWGITGASVTYQVFDVDGVELVAPTAMTETGTTGNYRAKNAAWNSDWAGFVVFTDGTNVEEVSFDPAVPTTAQIAAAVEAEVGSGATAAEVWAYADRALTRGAIRVVQNPQSGHISIIKGDSYLFVDGTHLVITKASGATWPTDLTGWTITATLKPTPQTARDNPSGPSSLALTGDVVTATGASQSVRLDVTAVQSATLIAGANAYKFDVQASSGTSRKTLEVGTASVVDQQTET